MSAHLLAALAALALAGSAPAPLFTDVTTGSGIPLQKHAEGVCMSDMDGDGLPELYLPSVKGRDRLYINLGGMKFKDITDLTGITVTGGIGAVVGDLDADGSKDVYSVRGAYPYGLNVLYMGGTGLKFTDVSEAAGVTSRKNGISATLVDFDSDGDPDIFVANWGVDTLYENDCTPGVAKFTDVSAPSGVGIDGRSWAGVSADFNGDALPDLFVARGGPGTADSSRLYINRGGKFEDATSAAGLDGVSAIGAITLDVDNDGDADLFTTSFEGPDRLFVNDGGKFRDATSASGIDSGKSVGAAAGDIDGDLLPDIVVAGFAGPVRVFRNTGGARFADVTSSYGTGAQKRNEGVALGDLDGDGDLDLYVASYDGHNALYLNGLDPKCFIRVRPVRGKRAAIGAAVRLYRQCVSESKPARGALTASGFCQAGYGFCSQSPDELIFVVPDDGPFIVETTFPGGASVELAGIGPGTYKVEYPETPPDNKGAQPSMAQPPSSQTR